MMGPSGSNKGAERKRANGDVVANFSHGRGGVDKAVTPPSGSRVPTAVKRVATPSLLVLDKKEIREEKNNRRKPALGLQGYYSMCVLLSWFCVHYPGALIDTQ